MAGCSKDNENISLLVYISFCDIHTSRPQDEMTDNSIQRFLTTEFKDFLFAIFCSQYLEIWSFIQMLPDVIHEKNKQIYEKEKKR